MKRILLKLGIILCCAMTSIGATVPMEATVSFRTGEPFWKVVVDLPGGIQTKVGKTDGTSVNVSFTLKFEARVNKDYEYRLWGFGKFAETEPWHQNTGEFTFAFSSDACWYVTGNGTIWATHPEETTHVTSRPFSVTPGQGAGTIKFRIRPSDVPYVMEPWVTPANASWPETVSLPADGKSYAWGTAGSGTYAWSIEGDNLGCAIYGNGVIRSGTKDGSIRVKAVASNGGCIYWGILHLGSGCGGGGGGGGGCCGGGKPNYSSIWGSGLSKPSSGRPQGYVDQQGNTVTYMYAPDGTVNGISIGYHEYAQFRVPIDGTPLIFPAPILFYLDGSSFLPDFFTVSGETEEILQVNTPKEIINVDRDGDEVAINHYYKSQADGSTQGMTDVSGSPFRTIAVTRANNNYDLVVTITEGSTVKTETIRGVTGGVEMESNGGLRKTVVTTETISDTVKERSFEVLQGSTIQVKQVDTITTYGFGSRVTQTVIGSGGATQTSTLEYYTNSNDADNYGDIKKVVNPDGSWIWYEYDDHVLVKEHHGFGNESPAATGNANYTTEYSFTPVDSNDDGSVEPSLPRKIVTKLKGHSIKQTLYSFTANQMIVQECVADDAVWNTAGNLVTKETSYSSGDFADVHKSTLHPDGTFTFYEYAFNESGPEDATQLTNTVWRGAPNGTFTGITKGYKTVSVQRISGEPVSSATYYFDGANTLLTSQEATTYTDELLKSHYVTHLDGSTDTVQHACCGIDYTRDRKGVETDFIFDEIGRQTGRVQNGILYTNILDAAGRVLVEKRMAGGVTNSLNEWAFQADGRLQYHTNVLGGITSYSYAVNGSGQSVTTITFPDAGTRVETRNKDGTLAKVTGTAAQPVRYEYDIDEDEDELWRVYTKEIKLDANGADTAEWTKTYRDLLDRAYLTIYFADGHGGVEDTMPRKRLAYNSLGQLAREAGPDGTVAMYGYSDLGELVYTATDMNSNQAIDFAGPDRITATIQDVVSAHDTNVVRTRTWVWDTDSQNASNLVSLVETSVDGRSAWMTIVTNGTSGSSGPVSFRQTSVLANSAYNVTNSAPDGSFSVETYKTGKLASVTRYTSSGSQVAKTSRSYDAMGRLWKQSDARNGDTVYIYNGADQPVTVTTPAPGNGQPSQTTTTYYDASLRAINVVHADGGTVTNEFFPTGALKKTSGSRTYPVEYMYDPQGRMRTMKTWQNFAGNSGAATTTWIYNERGFLTSKVYADSNGPEYTYNDAGKLLTRKWARGTPTRLTTTYAYNDAGDLWTTAYNDGVTPGVTNLYDRRGRLNSIAFNGTITSNIFHFGGGVLVETNIGGTLDGIAITNAFDSYLRKSAVAVYGYPATLNSYTYDTAGRLSIVSDGTNSATYSYLANSPLVSQIVFKENSTTRMTTAKKYDFLNRLQSIVSTPSATNEVPIAFEYAYNDANQRTRVTMEDGSFWIYKYDKLGQVTSGKRYWVDGTPVAGQQFEYAFDDIGNRTSTKEGGDATGAAGALRTSTYTLSGNLLNQYSQRTVPNIFEVMGSANSAATVTVNGQSTYRFGPYFEKALTITNSTAAQLLRPVATATLSGYTDNSTGQVFVAKTPETFSYDLDGNTIEDGRWTYKWDGENRLIEMISLTNTPTESKLWLKFGYDSGGRRIQKTVAQYTNSAWSLVLSNRFVYDGWNSLAELNATNNVLIQGNLWGIDLSGTMQGAGGIGGLVAVKDPIHAGNFLVFDGNGNVGGSVNAATGASTSRYEYEAFGDELRSSGVLVAAINWRHAGKYRDRETGLRYYGRRYLRRDGRWLSRDPIEEGGGPNLYGFVKNSPLSYSDMFGLAVFDLRDPGGLYEITYFRNGDVIIKGDGTRITITSNNLWPFSENSKLGQAKCLLGQLGFDLPAPRNGFHFATQPPSQNGNTIIWRPSRFSARQATSTIDPLNVDFFSNIESSRSVIVTLWHEMQGHNADFGDDSDAFDERYEKPVIDAWLKARNNKITGCCWRDNRQYKNELELFACLCNIPW